MKQIITSIFVGLALIAIAVVAFNYRAPSVSASVPVSNEYMATTTFGASTPTVRVLRPASGSLAQVTITGANTGFMTFYDATTSDITKRSATMASSSVLIADFPASVAAGTYTFDAATNYGLLLVTSGTPATSTITYR